MKVKPYTEELIPAVVAFNQRLKAGGVSYKFPEHPVPDWLPKLAGRKIFQEYFLAVENGSDVRGAFGLKHQEFSLNGETVSLGTCQLPISEGTVNNAYGSIGVRILLNAFERKALFYALGIGGYQEPLAVILTNLGWTLETVPLFFRVQHPFRFLRNSTFLRSTKLKRALADLLAFSGIGWIAFTLGNVLLPKKSMNDPPPQAEIAEDFEDWADKLWEDCKRDYALCAIRDSETLRILYLRTDARFIRLKVSQNRKVIGWAVLLDTQMVGSKYFGDMRVGSVVDCMALRKDARQVIRAATQYLISLGVDIVVSNQLDAAWGMALKDCGFLKGPSNFLFAASQQLAQRLQPFSAKLTAIHMTRGDGDGPINL
jgi:hypothetical protein